MPLDFDNLIIFIISNLIPMLMLKKSSLVFYSSLCIVSFFTFTFLMHLKFTLMYNISHGIILYFSQMAKQLSQHHWLQKSLFLPNYWRCHLHHTLISMSAWVCSIPFSHLSIYVLVTTLFLFLDNLFIYFTESYTTRKRSQAGRRGEEEAGFLRRAGSPMRGSNRGPRSKPKADA